MIIKFWGAARTVTGSMHLLKLANGKKILLDCGLYQGMGEEAEALNRDFPCEPSEIDCLILSHAHIDHCGNIPHLVRCGFNGRIYCTHATYDLVSIMLQDSAKIQEMDVEQENRRRERRGQSALDPLYTIKDAVDSLELFYTLPYRKWTKVEDGVEVLLLDAGHMLGSASVNLRIQEGARQIRLGFTGDIGRVDAPILRDPVPMLPCDVLISESTYGGTEHPKIVDARDALLQIIHDTCVVKRGKLIIPAFAVGRTQMLVLAMDQLHSEGKLPAIPVYVDSPLAVNATGVFEAHAECYDQDLASYLRAHGNPFDFKGLHYVRDTEDSKAINTNQEPMVIISASGMANAGRILHHIKHAIEDPRNTILMVGYCAKGTLGERLINGAEKVRIHGEEWTVKAEIKKLNAYSGHADQVELGEFIQASQDPAVLQQVFLVHGDEARALKFQAHLQSRGYKGVSVPARGEQVEI
jgi:metallo-beta-lactamase family protein